MTLAALSTTVKTNDPDHAGLHNAERTHINSLITTDRWLRGLALVADHANPTAYPDVSGAVCDYLNTKARAGGALYLPAGNYRWAADVRPDRPDHVTIRGEGKYLTRIYLDPGVRGLVLNNETTYPRNIVLGDLSFWGGRDGVTIEAPAGPTYQALMPTFERVGFFGQSEAGVMGEGPVYGALFSQCEFVGPAYGVRLTPAGREGSHDNTFQRCSFSQTGQAGIEIDHARDLTLDGCHFEANQRAAVRLTDCEGVTIRGGWLENNWLSGEAGADFVFNGSLAGGRCWDIQIMNVAARGFQATQGDPALLIDCPSGANTVTGLEFNGPTFYRAIRWPDGSIAGGPNGPSRGHWRDGVQFA